MCFCDCKNYEAEEPLGEDALGVYKQDREGHNIAASALLLFQFVSATDCGSLYPHIVSQSCFKHKRGSKEVVPYNINMLASSSS
jgi:hypothetical protein